MQILPIRISSWEIKKQIERGKSDHLTPKWPSLLVLISDMHFTGSFAGSEILPDPTEFS
jgi:hypothetical protein